VADPYPEVTVESRAQWRAWLAAHHAGARGVWLVTYKKGGERPHVPYAEVVEEALAHGWVDSRPRRLDAQRSMLVVTPRKPASSWSRATRSASSGFPHLAG
jgi:uncharacterized protein YdeI (YjbR/CyaY-like superfamily)